MNKLLLLASILIISSCATNKVTKHMSVMQSVEEKKAVEATKKCSEGKNYGCRDQIKSMYNSGKSKEAYTLATKWCESNKKEGCAVLGNLHSYDGEMEKALDFYKKGCKQNDGLACTLVASHHYANRKLDTAMRFARRSCRKNYYYGCSLVLILLRDMKDKVGKARFLNRVRAKCKKTNNPEICYLEGAIQYREKPEVASKIFKKICEEHTKRKFPDTPNEQLRLSIEAVFKSWMG